MQQSQHPQCFNERTAPVTVGPRGTDVRYDGESPELCTPPVVRTATGVLCSEDFFAYEVRGYETLHALFEKGQREFAAGLSGNVVTSLFAFDKEYCWIFKIRFWNMIINESFHVGSYSCVIVTIKSFHPIFY